MSIIETSGLGKRYGKSRSNQAVTLSERLSIPSQTRLT
jgi:hypothetical protein